MRAISGESAGSLADVADLVRAALQGRSPTSCLWVGSSGAFEKALESHLDEGGRACAIYAIASTGGEAASAESAYQFAGPPLALEEFPSLVDVIAFAQTRNDLPAITSAFADASRNVRRSREKPALDVIASDFQLRTFELVVVAGEQVLTGSIVNRTQGSAAVLFDGVKTTFGGAALALSLIVLMFHLAAQRVAGRLED